MESETFTLIYEKYRDAVFRIAVTYLKNKADALDAVQEVMIRVYRHDGTFASEEHLQRWIMKTAVNVCRDQLKSFWKRGRADADLTLFPAREDPDRLLLEEVFALPLKYRSVIYLHYYENYPLKEISEMLRISESAAKMRAKRGRELLRLELEKEEIR
ncbi:MAG: sigma-70 family RNA polymerase sigma factor [Solobacterium sp.]|nr:sigma-70 family RNA polymerase sigma factor [Solobacterium sp.]